jgi:DNA-nicking Smr family endonuclease
LHGLTAARASAELRVTVPAARRQGLRCLVVISGRGIHSPGGHSTIAELVVTELSVTLAAHVLAFRTAPPRFGGEGALVVRLRPWSP